MNCHEFDQRLQSLLDARRSTESDQELWDHARHCESCARRWQAYLAVERVLGDLPAAELPADLTDRVIARWSRRHPRRQKLAIGLLAAAAGLLIALPLWYRTLPKVKDRTSKPIAATQGTERGTAPPATPKQALALTDMVRQASDSYFTLAQESGRWLAEGRVLLPETGSADMGQPPLFADTPSWKERLRQPFTPLAELATDTWKLLEHLSLDDDSNKPTS